VSRRRENIVMAEYIYATAEKTVGTLLVLCVKRRQAVVLLLAVVVVIAMSESDGEISDDVLRKEFFRPPFVIIAYGFLNTRAKFTYFLF
jgi:hypothetical protein